MSVVSSMCGWRSAFFVCAWSPLLLASGCGHADERQDAREQERLPTLTLDVAIDGPALPGSEEYVCFGFDASAIAGRAVQRIEWTAPLGPVQIHHGVLWAYETDIPDGPFTCDAQPPGGTGIHVYTPGGGAFEFPEDVGIEIRPDTKRIRLEAHVFRLSTGPALPTQIRIYTYESPPMHLASWIDDRAPVLPLPAHRETTSVGQCKVGAEAHVVATWPHMHRLGRRFDGTVVRASGVRESLIHVDPWDFFHQPMYLANAVLQPGDAVETLCDWQNSTEELVVEGPRTIDEMCNQGLWVWPAEAARCVR